jgi:hypothetical protein
MQRADAEGEAERRNRDDPDARRYEFYAYDESAGLAPDAWEVGARLRRDSSIPSPRPPPPPPPSEGVAAVPELYAEPPPESWLEQSPAPPAPATRRRARRGVPTADPDRAGVFVRSLGAAVIAMGMLWMGTVVALAVLLKPDDATGVGLYLGAAVLGLLAIALGAAIRRS